MSNYEIGASIMAAVAIVLSVFTLVTTQRRENERTELERARAEREIAAELSTRMAKPSTDYLGRKAAPERTFQFRVTNTGKDHLYDLKPFLVNTKGQVISEPLPLVYLPGLKPDERAEFWMSTKMPADGNRIYLKYEWGDGSGLHEHLSKVEIPKD
jgi:hypothetical protein